MIFGHYGVSRYARTLTRPEKRIEPPVTKLVHFFVKKEKVDFWSKFPEYGPIYRYFWRKLLLLVKFNFVHDSKKTEGIVTSANFVCFSAVISLVVIG